MGLSYGVLGDDRPRVEKGKKGKKGTDHVKFFPSLKITHFEGGAGGLMLIFCPSFLPISIPLKRRPSGEIP